MDPILDFNFLKGRSDFELERKEKLTTMRYAGRPSLQEVEIIEGSAQTIQVKQRGIPAG